MSSQRQRFELARDAYLKALRRLHQAAVLPEDDIVRDALIQRFEFTYEMGWKALYLWLRGEGEQVPQMGRAVLRMAFTAQVISDAQLWEEIKDARDETSHTYNEARAVAVAAFVRAKALGAFDALALRLEGL